MSGTLIPYHRWLKTHPGGSMDDYFTDVQGLTPYDKGTRLEPRPWIQRDPGLTPAMDLDDYGKVDFDNEESATEAIVYIEKRDPGYTLNVHNLSTQPLKVEMLEEGEPVPVIQPTEALRRNVQLTIDADVDPRVRDEVEVYYAENNRRAMILVPGEQHVRKQLLLFVTDVGEGEVISAYVKSWAAGVRETRL